MHRVSFIDCESGTDLIVAFAVEEPEDPGAVESLIALRTPKFEGFLEEWERGAMCSFGPPKGDNDRSLLRKVSFDQANQTIELRCDSANYELSIARVDKSEIARMRKTFRKMNFDSSIELDGL